MHGDENACTFFLIYVTYAYSIAYRDTVYSLRMNTLYHEHSVKLNGFHPPESHIGLIQALVLPLTYFSFRTASNFGDKIDFAIISAGLYKQFNNFSVLKEEDMTSDHTPILVELKLDVKRKSFLINLMIHC